VSRSERYRLPHRRALDHRGLEGRADDLIDTGVDIDPVNMTKPGLRNVYRVTKGITGSSRIREGSFAFRGSGPSLAKSSARAAYSTTAILILVDLQMRADLGVVTAGPTTGASRRHAAGRQRRIPAF
jgi:hypothetical protein